ncbi:T9SS type A sorting domain-containing protein [Hymenobacter cavernae]|nr:T9SS type A sorting domain-containing protein [Hymenobacter cavernae]
MKHALLLTFVLLMAVGRSYAQYQTPGTGVRWTLDQLAAASGGTVTGAGPAFQVNNTIRLAANDTLLINTNATVRLASLALFYVDGVLLVNPPDSAKFTAVNPAAPFHSFSFSATSTGSQLRKTIVEYGGGIKVVGANLLIDRCAIRYQVTSIGNTATNSGAINMSGSGSTITNCRIYRNGRSAILSPSNGGVSPVIRGNVLIENDTENGNYPQINLGPGGATPIIIENNLIVGRYLMSGGIAVSNLLGSPNGTQVVIRKNVIRNNRYGVTIIGSNINSYITQNTIENNNINPNAATGGSGISLQGTGTQTGVVSRNSIKGNLWGVTMIRSSTTAASGPVVSFGEAGSSDTTNVGLNQFANNSNGGQVYDFYNNIPNNTKAENNGWGTASATEIENHIYHKVDSEALGLVDFQPFLTPLATHTANRLTVAAYPNPARESVTFALPTSTAAHVQVRDALGRVVAELQARPSTGQLVLPTAQLAPGLYTYRLTQEKATATGKLLVTK